MNSKLNVFELIMKLICRSDINEIGPTFEKVIDQSQWFS